MLFRSDVFPSDQQQQVSTQLSLTLIGILPGHWLVGSYFTATSMIGFIALLFVKGGQRQLA